MFYHLSQISFVFLTAHYQFVYLAVCQKNGILNSNTGLSNKDHLLKRMVLQVLQGFDWQKHFPSIEDHRFDIEAGIQDDHLTQLIKILAITFLNLCLLTYGQAHHRGTLPWFAAYFLVGKRTQAGPTP